MNLNTNKETSEHEQPLPEDEFSESDLKLSDKDPFDEIGASYEEIPAVEERNLAGMFGHDIISLKNGVRIAKVEDILLDPEKLCLAGVITSKGRLLNRKVEAIKAENVQVWGKDVLIVSHPEVVRTSDELADYASLLSIQDQVRGREVVSIKGERIGQVEGALVDNNGSLSALLLTKAVAGSKRLPISAVQSLGKDVLIVDLSKGG
jgi:uncharacterized protein YrrD